MTTRAIVVETGQRLTAFTHVRVRLPRTYAGIQNAIAVCLVLGAALSVLQNSQEPIVWAIAICAWVSFKIAPLGPAARPRLVRILGFDPVAALRAWPLLAQIVIAFAILSTASLLVGSGVALAEAAGVNVPF